MSAKTVVAIIITIAIIFLALFLAIVWQPSPTEVQYPRALTLADLDEHPEERDNVENYWFSANVNGSDGNRYALRITTSPVNVYKGSAWLYRYNYSEQPNNENFIGPTIVTRYSDHVSVKRGDNWRMMLTPKSFKIEIWGKSVDYNLTYTPIGLPFMYGKGKKAEIAQEMWGTGYEALSTIEGTIAIQGNPITVEGKGTHEHFWGNVTWDYTTNENWLPIHFEEAAILLFRVDRVGGGAYQDGIIHLLTNDEYLIVNHVEVEEINERRDLQIIAKTEEGASLSLLGISYAQFNPGHHALSFSGKLEYGEQVLNLTNGDGWRESVLM